MRTNPADWPTALSYDIAPCSMSRFIEIKRKRECGDLIQACRTENIIAAMATLISSSLGQPSSFSQGELGPPLSDLENEDLSWLGNDL
jgi:hypothetical protein